MSATPSRGVEGKRVIVTAGASGIGFAIAKAFAQSGAAVCVADVSSEFMAQVSAAHPAITTRRCDVGDPEQVAALFAGLPEQWNGKLDVLVNNAGIAGPKAPIERIEWRDWEKTMRVNVGGMFLCIQQAIPLWQRNGGGAVINISTSSARTGLPQRLPYVVSKAAVHGLTLNVARELGPINVSCNAVLPGLVDNERGRALVAAAAERDGMSYEQALADTLRFVSMRAVIDPAEIAALCLHLASPAGARISGQLIGVCGNTEWE